MSQEIRTQIEGIQGMKKPEHFTFDQGLFDDLDKIYSTEGSSDNEYDIQWLDNSSPRNIFPPAPPPKQNANIHSLERQIKKLQEKLTEKRSWNRQ